MLQIFTLIGALGMFLYGMNLMSSGLQKAAGDRLRNFLSSMTSNSFKRVMTGVGITALIQSSSATTVMVVSFVNAGLLTLVQAIGVIMGANIGTTVTAWIISLLGFKADISILAIPMMALGFIFSISKKDSRKNYGELIIGFCLLFLGLSFMKESVPDLRQTPEVLEFIKQWTGYGFGSVLIFLFIGTILTLVLQSSSATMALTLIMLNMGWIPFPMAAAMVLGENIGTTITANIAASVGNTSSKRAAFAHTVFNLFGVTWALLLFRPFTSLVGKVIEAMGFPNPAASDFVALGSDDITGVAALYGLSMYHTLFNVINTCILVWFPGLIEKCVVTVIKGKKDESVEIHKLKYIGSKVVATPELSCDLAMKEIVHFAEISYNGFKYMQQAIVEKDKNKLDELNKKLIKYEEISDRIEYEIATFLNQVATTDISEETSIKMRSMYKIIGELESLGDSGEKISRILTKKNLNKTEFDESHISNLKNMLEAVEKAYTVMTLNVSDTEKRELELIDNAENAERSINALRDNLKEEEIINIEKTKDNYFASVCYLDTITEMEKMGDYLINISQACAKMNRAV